MSFVAAGMESDQSDSDYEPMIFNHGKPSNSINEVKRPKNPNLDFVAVSADTVAANGSFVPIAETLPNIPQARSNYPKNHSKAENRNGQIYSAVTHKNQPLDDLRYAAIQGNLEVIKSIINQDVKIDCVLKSGWTGLMYACSSAHDEIVQYFLEKGANPNYDKDFFTPLMAVCASTKPEPNLLKCCQHLLKHKAEVNVHERHLTTPLMFAAREGHFQIVQELLKAGADIKRQDNRGKTALMWAVSKGYGQIVRYLLVNGANPNEIDNFGQTAADLATHYDYQEIAVLLEKSSSLVPEEMSVAKVTDAETKEKNLELKLFPSNSSFRLQQNSRCYNRKDELEIFLRGLGIPEMIEIVKTKHQLTLSQLLNLNEKELEDIGIDKIGIRKQIIDASQTVHKEKWKRSSLPNMKQLPYISCPDAVGMIANIVNHLEFISCQIVYIRLQIQAEPKILELSQDTANVHNLVEETDNGVQKIQTLFNELQFLKLYLHQVQGNTQYIPADLIEENGVKVNQSIWRTKVVFGVFIISVTIGGILWKKPESLAHFNSLITSKIPYLK